jgi:hypothetical protein
MSSSYARYCRDQAAECARRVKLASSPEVAANARELGLRWVKLARKAEQVAQQMKATKNGRPLADARL